MAERPLLITIMAILIILFGLLALLAGLIIAGLSGLISVASFTEGTIPAPGVPIELLQLLGLAGTAFGIIVIFFAVIVLLVGRGFWNGSNWARILAIILFGLSALGDIWSLVTAGIVLGPVVSLIIAVFFIYYLTRSHVEAFFS